MASAALSVGEVATRFGVRDSALRYYERLGLLRPARNASGQRSYHEEDLRALAFLLMCRDGGLQLDEVAVLMGRPAPDGRRWQELVQDHITAVDEAITRMRAAREWLSKALRCSSDHPAVECPYARHDLDQLVHRATARADHHHRPKPRRAGGIDKP